MDDELGVLLFQWCLGIITVLMMATLLVMMMTLTYQLIVEGVTCG